MNCQVRKSACPHTIIKVPRGLLTPSRQMLGEYFELYRMASLHFLSISLFINIHGVMGQRSQFGDKGTSWTIPFSNTSSFKIFFLRHNVQNDPAVLRISYSMGIAEFFSRGKSAQNVKFTTHFHFLLTLKVSTHLLLLPLRVFISWTGANLFSFLFPLNHSSQYS
jgi:hypothetical protein